MELKGREEYVADAVEILERTMRKRGESENAMEEIYNMATYDFETEEVCEKIYDFFSGARIGSTIKYKPPVLLLAGKPIERKVNPFQNRFYTCGKCGSNETNVTEKQTRRGDEAATKFIMCKCGNRWKKND